MTDRTYIAIDLKSFYASAECMERGLDPMTTNLVVADRSRTAKQIVQAVTELYDRITDQKLLVRRISMAAGHVIPRSEALGKIQFEQMDLFTDYAALQKEKEKEQGEQERERKMQEAVLQIKRKFGKNAILKGMNLEEGATARERNSQIGGHRA